MGGGGGFGDDGTLLIKQDPNAGPLYHPQNVAQSSPGNHQQTRITNFIGIFFDRVEASFGQNLDRGSSTSSPPGIFGKYMIGGRNEASA